MIKKLFYVLLISLFCFPIYSITFSIPLKNKDGKDATGDREEVEPGYGSDENNFDLTGDAGAESGDVTVDVTLDHVKRERKPEQRFLDLKAVFDIGFGIGGTASDQSGIYDLETFFFRPAFFIQKFGIGLDIPISFRVFPERFIFQSERWYVPGDTGRTAFALLDKIDFISYGDKEHFIYSSTGKLPFFTLGTGLMMNNFHNSFFMPIDRENGFFFIFDGTKLDKYKVPLTFSFLTPDLFDFDIMGFEAGFDILDFLKYKDLNLKVGATAVMDYDSDESNTLSADTMNSVQYYRNNRVSSIVAGFSLPASFTLTRQHVQLLAHQELGFLFTKQSGSKSVDFGLAGKAATEVRLANIKDSGFLVGLKAGLIFRYNDFDLNYFSSNYQMVRRTQIYDSLETYNIYADAGLSIYALQERLQFNFMITFPMIVQGNFKSKIQMSFIYDGRKVTNFIPGLYVALHFENDMDIMTTEGNGGPFLESFTRGFRYSAEIGYRVFCAKMSFIIGVQRPNWIKDNNYIDVEKNTFKTDQYGKDLQKFMIVEVSFVL